MVKITRYVLALAVLYAGARSCEQMPKERAERAGEKARQTMNYVCERLEDITELAGEKMKEYHDDHYR